MLKVKGVYDNKENGFQQAQPKLPNMMSSLSINMNATGSQRQTHRPPASQDRGGKVGLGGYQQHLSQDRGTSANNTLKAVHGGGK